jgi:hypothetical protein
VGYLWYQVSGFHRDFLHSYAAFNISSAGVETASYKLTAGNNF